MALNRSDKSRILRRYSPGMTRNSEMSTEPSYSRGPAGLRGADSDPREGGGDGTSLRGNRNIGTQSGDIRG